MRGRSTKKEVVLALLERHISPVGGRDGTWLEIQHSSAIGAFYFELAEILHKIAHCTTVLYKVKKINGQMQLHANSLGTRLMKLLGEATAETNRALLYYDYQPYVRVLMEIIRRYPEYLEFSFQLWMAQLDPIRWSDSLNRLVDEYRCNSSGRIFLSQLSARQKLIQSRYERLRDHFRKTDLKYPCSKVISIELGYVEYSCPFNSTIEMQYQRLHTDVQFWLQSVERSFGGVCVGGAWKLDVAQVGAYRAHAVLIMHGPNLSDIPEIAKELGNLWVNRVGLTAYSIHCHQEYDSVFEYRGFNEQLKRSESVQAELDAYAIYMAKADEYLCLNPVGKPPAHGLILENSGNFDE